MQCGRHSQAKAGAIQSEANEQTAEPGEEAAGRRSMFSWRK